MLNIVYSIEEDSTGNDLTDFLAAFADKKKELLFALSFMKSIDESNRAQAFENFSNRVEYNATTLNSSQKQALADVYNLLVGKTFQETLKTDHGINDKVMLGLFGCIRGSFVLTDSSVAKSKLSVKSINSSFSQRLAGNISKYFDTINGESTNNGRAILEEIINEVNESEKNDNIAKYKTLFGGMDLYVPAETEGSSRPGGGGSIVVGDPVTQPPSNPIVIPSPPITASTVTNLTFPDMTVSRWSAPYVSELVSRNILRGYDDGSFKPEQGITREELAVALVRCLGLEGRLESVSDMSFTDNGEISDWAKKSIALLVEMGIYKGYDDGSFKPARVITRQELSAIIARSLTKVAHNVNITFADKDEIGNWAFEAIKKIYALGIIKGYEDNSFRPESFITREEVAAMLYNFMYTEKLL